MYKARNVDDYVELINQALFEVEDLILCAEDEGEDDNEFSIMTPDLRVIEAGLKALHAEILGGDYAIGRGEDLPFMSVVQKVRKRLPIVSLIDAINSAHKKGFARD
jgi:tetrahydromethanopterin S-methyltransferase subunit A